MVVQGEHIDTKCDYETDGHVELGENILLITEGKLELGEGSTDPHWQLMAYVRAYYTQKRSTYRVGQSRLPVILLAYHGAFIPLVSVLAADAFQGHISTHLGLSFVPTDQCKWKH